MKRKISVLLAVVMLLTVPGRKVYAVGESNINNGGGGMGTGTSSNKWSPGNEGVRVTVVRASDQAVVTEPIDLTNKKPTGAVHFNKISKLQYSNGTALTPSFSTYIFFNPTQALPKIISSQSLGAANIDEIKSYFTDEQVIRSIASTVRMDFDVLVNGEYKLLIEPVSYLIYEDVFFAMTATEAALYDEITNGGVRSRLPTVGFQNLPLAMFLETADLGYPAWDGPKTGVRSNQEIKAALGLGAIRFKEMEKDGELEVNGYENPPPNPVADDRNDQYQKTSVPNKEQKAHAEWTVWRPYWYAYWVWHSGDEDDDGFWCDHARLVSGQSA